MNNRCDNASSNGNLMVGHGTACHTVYAYVM